MLERPYDQAWEAENQAIALVRWFKILLIVVVTALLCVIFAGWKIALPAIAGVVFCFYRTHQEMSGLRFKVNQLFVYHKSKSPETCGSMDPHLTQVRN